ncbi:MAG: iron-containing redox enzyme family protein [Verrucomicrobiales bacterium]|nr:iron-containing redox enzyme family protein [Verrucomicrobiae bacterium]
MTTDLKQPRSRKVDPTAKPLADELQRSLDRLVEEIRSTEFFVAISAPSADREIASATLKHIYLSIYQYQPHVTEATFTAVGRMPKHSERLIKTMIRQQVEEVEHADMALRDYERLGGDPTLAEGPMFPECAAVAAVCHFLGEHCHPASYLGFMYIFEALTPVMAAEAQKVMAATNYLPAAREFVDLHATEDIKHTDMILAVIQQLIRVDPDAKDAILFGLRTFTTVYPIPVWDAAYRRAVGEKCR